MKAKIAAGLLILVILLAGCATQNPQGNAQANDKLRMGMVVYVGEGPYFVADEKGFFADEGVDVEFVSFSDPAVLKSAFAGNQLDGYFFTADAIAFDASSGLEGKIFWVPSSSDGADGIIAGTAIQSVQDLNGKKIAFLEGSPSHFFLAQILKANDMTFQDIQTVNLDPDKAAEAFFAGNVDGAVTWEPWLSKTVDFEDTHVLISSKETPDTILDAFMTHDETLTRQSDALVKFTRGLQRGIAYSEEHPDEAAQIAAPHFQMTPSDYQAAVQSIDFQTVSDNQRLFQPNGPLAQIVTAAEDVWFDAGLITRRKPASELVDGRIVAAVAG